MIYTGYYPLTNILDLSHRIILREFKNFLVILVKVRIVENFQKHKHTNFLLEVLKYSLDDKLLLFKYQLSS